MAYAEPGGIASAAEYNKVVDNVNAMGWGTLFSRIAATGQTQSIATGSWTRIAFPTGLDSCPHITTNAAGDTFTVVTSGVFDIAAAIRAPGGAGARHIRMASGSDYNIVYAGNTASGPSPNIAVCTARPRKFAVGDTISVWAWQDSGASITTSPAGESIHVVIAYRGVS